MINAIVVCGRMTRDPEVKKTTNDIPVVNFTLACDNGFGDKKKTDFIDCTAWRNNATFLGNYGAKGRLVIVSGRLQSDEWTDKDGNKRTKWEVVVNDLQFGDAAKRGDVGTSDPPYTETVLEDLTDDDGQLPF